MSHPSAASYITDADLNPPRDLVGYGRVPPTFNLPGGAKVAVNFVINYEEGGENSMHNGDTAGEAMLQETGPAKQPLVGHRDFPVESQFEYGSRVGIWRLLDLFEKHNYPVTGYVVAKTFEHNKEVAEAFGEGEKGGKGHEVASHCFRWFNYEKCDPEEESTHIRSAISSFIATTGKAPVGWYYGRPSPNTKALLANIYRELGLELLYFADTYADDLPYWTPSPGTDKKEGLLMMPYSYDLNDFKFFIAPGFGSAGAYFEYAKNAFDTLYDEGAAGKPKYMTVALHARYMGRPGRFQAIKDFVEYISKKEGVWVATREQIAREWVKQYPYDPKAFA